MLQEEKPKKMPTDFTCRVTGLMALYVLLASLSYVFKTNSIWITALDVGAAWVSSCYILLMGERLTGTERRKKRSHALNRLLDDLEGARIVPSEQQLKEIYVILYGEAPESEQWALPETGSEERRRVSWPPRR